MQGNKRIDAKRGRTLAVRALTGMGQSFMAVVIDLQDFDAFLFDLDGVITMTAGLHAAAWKKLFDEHLAAHAAHSGVPFVPFDIVGDYRAYVDGKARQAGIRDFLASRGIRVPDGTPHDDERHETVRGLAKRKNRYFLALLKNEGLRVYDSAVGLVREARTRGMKTAVVSASRNTASILRVARLTHLFQERVDGVEAARLELPGKPDPAMFLEAARRLNVAPARAVVFEDATAGVEAGRRGGFGLVVGVGDAEQSSRLREHGADVVVADLGAITLTPREDAAA
jgi:beta-phosphoglucomutase family hydrolase